MRWADRDRRDTAPVGDEGFTLVEILVATLVFALTATATVGILITAIRTVRENSDRVYAANLARSEIERQRELGTDLITIGNTTSSTTTPEGVFTISTTSNWVGLNQATDACEAAAPGQAYMRVHVEVTGASISETQVSDTIIAPSDDSSLVDTGQLAIKVADERANPVSGVTLQVRNVAAAGPTTTYITGPDGCVFVPKLSPSSAWQVVINRGGYVPRIVNGTTASGAVIAAQTTRMSFEYAAASSIEFTSSSADFPIPDGIPLSTGLDPLAIMPIAVTAYPKTVSSLWPSVGGYQGWLGTCIDSDPASFAAPRTTSANRTWFAVTPGAKTTAPLGGATVRVRGLPANSLVRIAHAAEPTGNCTVAQAYDIGRTDAQGVLRVQLPYGKWTFSSTAAPGANQVVILEPAPVVTGTPSPTPTATPTATPTPTATGIPVDTKGAQVTVSFPVASLDIPTPSPTPTATPTATPTVTATPTPSVTP
jgi:prepilin-type N-terminal cleavage/methylation domain-containing protein